METYDRARTSETRVLLIDDHRTFTDLVGLALDREPDLHCVGAAHTAVEARLLVDQERPDVVLMDVDLGGDDGLELTATLLREHPGLLVVVMTAHADRRVMERTAAVGACALIPKDGSLPDLLGGLRGASPGGLFVHPALLRSLVAGATSQGPSHASLATPAPVLTARELDVLVRLADGHHVAAIARELGISVHTCRGYVKVLLSKMGARSQLQAVVIARRHGLLDLTPGR